MTHPQEDLDYIRTECEAYHHDGDPSGLLNAVDKLAELAGLWIDVTEDGQVLIGKAGSGELVSHPTETED